MSLWRRDRDDARLDSAEAYYGEPAIEVTRFEYIPVGETALTRITARWQDALPEPADVALILRNGHGAELLEVLPDSQFDPHGRWRIAFAAPLEAMRKPNVTFALQVGDEVLDLPEPARSQRRFERAAGDEVAQLKHYLEDAERDRDAARDVATLLRAEIGLLREQVVALASERDELDARASAASAAAGEARARGNAVAEEITRVRAELSAATGRAERLEADQAAERERVEAHLQTLQDQHAAELATLNAERATEIEMLNTEHATQLATLNDERTTEREALARDRDTEHARAETLGSELEEVRLRVAALDVSLREYDQVDGEVVVVDEGQPDGASVALARVPAGLDRTELREVVDARNRLSAAQVEFDTAREALRTSLFAHGADASVAQAAVEREQEARAELDDAQAAWDSAWGPAEAALTPREPGAPRDEEI